MKGKRPKQGIDLVYSLFIGNILARSWSANTQDLSNTNAQDNRKSGKRTSSNLSMVENAFTTRVIKIPF